MKKKKKKRADKHRQNETDKQYYSDRRNESRKGRNTIPFGCRVYFLAIVGKFMQN